MSDCLEVNMDSAYSIINTDMSMETDMVPMELPADDWEISVMIGSPVTETGEFEEF